MELGIFVIVQMLNLLLVASSYLPSLGILFRTIEKSLNDMFVFTTIVFIIFLVFVVMTHIIFGTKTYAFSNLNVSMVTCFRMFLGEFPYTSMY